MSEETIDAIIEEMRGRADAAFPYDAETMSILDHLADRLDGALKRERAANTCECGDIAILATMHGADVANKKHAKARAALVKLTRPTTSDLHALLDLAKFAIDHCMYGGGVLQALVDAVIEGKRVLEEEGGAS